METLGYFFPFFFIGMWLLVSFILSRMGWVDLVAHYETEDSFVGQKLGVISALINGVSYNNSLVLKYNERGIYLRPIFLFRLFHKPVFIPWTEIKEVRDKKILFSQLKELIIGHPFVASIKMKKSVFSRMENSFHQYALRR